MDKIDNADGQHLTTAGTVVFQTMHVIPTPAVARCFPSMEEIAYMRYEG